MLIVLDPPVQNAKNILKITHVYGYAPYQLDLNKRDRLYVSHDNKRLITVTLQFDQGTRIL